MHSFQFICFWKFHDDRDPKIEEKPTQLNVKLVNIYIYMTTSKVVIHHFWFEIKGKYP